MKIQFENQVAKSPRVSFVLLDWSCRESFHGLDYFANQNIPRDQYEIIWIEYYHRVSPQIEQKMKECEQSGKPPVIDQWIVMEMPENIYYHKHLMYNLGIIAAKGEIVVICDSDVMVKPTFVESIIEEFDSVNNSSLNKSGIVLHLDEVRNINRKYYPFNHPTFEEVMAQGCINWVNGKTKGLWDEKDPLHSRNYGACMAARKEDLIAIGGADEHIDYLGHICGPYEMTFRLVNAGKKEIWHHNEFMFHTWHPGTDGSKNYLGPHDGQNLSTAALQARYQARVMSLQENSSIKILRTGQKKEDVSDLLFRAVSDRDLSDWESKNLEMKRPSLIPQVSALKIIVEQVWDQFIRFCKKPKTLKALVRGIFVSSFYFLRESSQRSNLEVMKCQDCMNEFQSEGVTEFAILGLGRAAEILHDLTLDRPQKIITVFDSDQNRNFHGIKITPMKDMKAYQGKIVIGSFYDVDTIIKVANDNGVEGKRLTVIC